MQLLVKRHSRSCGCLNKDEKEYIKTQVCMKTLLFCFSFLITVIAGAQSRVSVITTTKKTDQRTSLFDGVYMDADVWLNGHHLGSHPYGYTPFYLELQPWLKPAGQRNVLAVRVHNLGKNSRWYSGSGIYRHVWLVRTAPLHIPIWGVYI